MLDFVTQTWLFGAVYGAGPYGAGTYNDGVSAAASTSSAGGSLVNTGTVLIAITTLACLLVFTALLVRFWKRRHSVHYVRTR